MIKFKHILTLIITTTVLIAGFSQHRGGHIQNKDLSEKSFTKGDFYGARASGANFTKSILKEANFQGADLKNTQFKGADVSKAIFYGADMKIATMYGATADEANFEGADMHRGSFNGSSFRCARFKGTSLNTATCLDCNFSGANLDGADLRAADLSGSKFTNANITSNTLIDSNTKGLPAKHLWGQGYRPGLACKDQISDYPNESTITEREIRRGLFVPSLCPNTADGHLVQGNRHLDGEVHFEVEGNIYFNGSKTKLLVDIHLKENALSTNTRIDAQWTGLEIYSAPNGFQIADFNTDRGSRRSDGKWYQKIDRYPVFDGVKSFSAKGTLPSGGSEVKGFSWNDGVKMTFTLTGESYVLHEIVVVGDTGTEDISHDRDCSHDSKIVSISPDKDHWNVKLKKI